MKALLLRGGEVDGLPADVLVVDGRIRAVGADLAPPVPHDTLEVRGGAVLPGLHDHHLHLLAMAAARASVDVRAVPDPAAFDRALRSAAARSEGALRVVGWHERHCGPLDRHRLDRLVPDRPVRAQHATGAAWVLNSPALRALDGAAAPGDDGWRYGPAADPVGGEAPSPLDLAAVGRDLRAVGVTGVTDATPFTVAAPVRLLAAAVEDGSLPQRVVVTGGLGLPAADGLPRGPVKLVVADHEAPDLGALAASIRAAHDRGRPVAVHCITAVALALLLAAWDDVGVHEGDRVEHAAVVDPAAALALAALGVTVVTQPNFVTERGDRYRADVDEADRPHLWPCGGLLAAGVPVAAGTDAPFGRPDPWRAMAAAVHRRTASGAVLGPDERIAPARALDLFLGPLEDPGGPPRRVLEGALADLCVLDRPRADALADLATVEVAATVIGGWPASG